jgi:4-hydroxy-3-methylbut-2-enyl diphosphate reductase
MKIIRSKVLGFCMGVRRAVSLAEAEADRVKSTGGQVYTFGSLIHNPKVLSDLENRGVKVLKDSQQNLVKSSVIIRAHGIDPKIEKDLRGRGARIVDATCPKVKASQLKAQELSRAGYCLFLAGEAHHAEIEGILGFTKDGESSVSACVVVGNAAEAETAAKKLQEAKKCAKTALIGQTTISEEEYAAIGEAIKKYFPNLEIIQTICSATKDRQKALRDLLDDVDAVIIAGGKDSANTRRLLAIAQESGKPCALIENSGEIPDIFKTFGTVGLSAGASTPDSVIDEIEAELYH